MVQTSDVAGIVAGRNPLKYSASSPYTMFLFQIIVILAFCLMVHYPLKKIQQPKVIAEVITGILLGPTVLGRIPNFTETCFPTESISGLTLLANVGIILFLFIVGLEVDIGYIKKNLRAAVTVGLINMAIPFGLGCAISVGIYEQYGKEENTHIKFTTYMVFIAVATCITAFPVLARILTELNLIGDRVGTIVLAAGITNDLMGWILLALTVTLANASEPINTLYILLLTVAWFFFLLYPVRLALKFYLTRYTNNLATGEPSQFLMMIIIVLVFISSFYTDIIGVHPIFGAFMVGIIVPRDNGFVIRITEKLEDLVHIILIPIYFALAGLNVNLGLLSTGTDWGYTIGIIALAMIGKIFGGFIAAKLNKLFWRESLAVGVLMSCKGIVEIVVLNVGLNAKIITQKVYSMFIVMALITTFLTTPLSLVVYPNSYREKVSRVLKGEINWDGTPVVPVEGGENEKSFDVSLIKDIETAKFPQIIMLLKNVDSLSPLMSFIENFFSLNDNYRAIHLREFSSRTSHLLEASNEHTEKEYISSTSILSIVKVFSEILGIKILLKSVLSTFKNHVLTVNDSINSENDLILTSNKLSNIFNNNGEIGGESDSVFYKDLLHHCKCNLGILLNSARSTENSIIEEEEAQTIADDTSSVNLIVNHDNFLSSSDILSLRVAHKLSLKSNKVNIYIKSPSKGGFVDDIQNLFETSDVHIHFLKSGLDEIPFSKNQLFLVANNISKDEDILFTKEVNQLIELSQIENFNVLVVKSPFV